MATLLDECAMNNPCKNGGRCVGKNDDEDDDNDDVNKDEEDDDDGDDDGNEKWIYWKKYKRGKFLDPQKSIHHKISSISNDRSNNSRSSNSRSNNSSNNNSDNTNVSTKNI
ncbi:hypothetical protein HELRODRAFT_184216 [Helobdella robusta]|uniref:Uncharacterized protein n=1 Tax=Helobdella robusta TaxID=6412 RepID=T1FKS4_HELRO|nr:hypothetical protein HELRODRAFT_184216 [Helobdella robusta]ESO05135.1 hypothetical protein HELRODRAFT_184216 [Helobdella robusta]